MRFLAELRSDNSAFTASLRITIGGLTKEVETTKTDFELLIISIDINSLGRGIYRWGSDQADR